MKKSIIFCFCVALVALFISCDKKEGVYNPSKKIQKIYTVEDGDKELSEVWHWDGKVLTSIDYIDDMYATTATFSYDKNNRMIFFNYWHPFISYLKRRVIYYPKII